MSLPNIKLFVCCHREIEVPKHPLLVPIQVGAALAGSHFPGFVYDDSGENISEKNRSYCELTAQYWAWKNVEADYYGFFHYRRYLYPDAEVKRPYRIERRPTLPLLDKLGYGRFAELIQKYDLIVPKAENMFVSVREHYAAAPNHHVKDLALVEQIVTEQAPEMTAAMNEYLSGTRHYFGNIYIMHRDVFLDYSGWLFPILEEFDRRADLSGYSEQEKRVDGYLAERLLGVYTTFRRRELKTLELPRVHFLSGQDFVVKKLAYAVVPPGSKRRSAAKRVLGRG